MEIIRNADGSCWSLFPKVDITTMTTPLRPRRRRCGECRGTHDSFVASR